MANLPTKLEQKNRADYRLPESFVIKLLKEFFSTKVEVCQFSGASSGIGRGLAIEFAKHGVQLALTGRNKEELKNTKQIAILNSGTAKDQIFLHIADLTNTGECEKLVASTVEKFGKLDILINNAGLFFPGSIETQTLEEYDAIMNVNNRAVFALTQAAVPHLKQTKGNIVNISSVTGSITLPGFITYSASKAALNHMTKSTAIELAPYKIRCNSVSPTVIDTPLIEKLCGNDKNAAQKFLKDAGAVYPLGRAGKVDDVTKPVVFLASDALRGLITGTDLVVDAGIALTCAQQTRS